MNAYEDNVQAIVDYFESGIKSEGETGRLGVEIEHIVVDGASGPVMYSGDCGVRWILEQMSVDYPDKTYGDEGSLLGLGDGAKTITLEPAAQLELSAGPYEYAVELREDYLAFQNRLNELVGAHDRKAVAIGYHPTAMADQLELIPKQRYRYMDEHFAKIGPFGRCMMRGSAATQVSIDYYSQADCLRKLRLASAASPLLALICDNSPVFEGKPRTHHMVRTEIWQKCDPARCNTVPGALDPDFTFRRYAEYVLSTPAIFGVGEDGRSFATDKTFGELYADSPMTQKDVEHALSLFFNDVRLKTYVEIRPADSMPIPFAAAYATLIKALFYSEESLQELESLFEGAGEKDVMDAKESLMANGYEAKAFGRHATELVDEIMETAQKALPPGERMFLNPLTQLTQSRKTLAMLAERR